MPSNLEMLAGVGDQDQEVQDNTPDQAASGGQSDMVSLADAFRPDQQRNDQTSFTSKGQQSEPMVSLADLANAPEQTQSQRDAGYLQSRMEHYRGLGAASLSERLDAGIRAIDGTNTIDEREQERQRIGQTGNMITDYLPFTGHLNNLDRENRYNQAVERIDAGRGSNTDFDHVAQFITTQERNSQASFMERVGSGILRLPAFMGELSMTGGLAGVARSGTAGLVGRALGETALTTPTIAGRVATAVPGLAAGLATWTAANPATIADTSASMSRPHVGTDAQGNLSIRRDGDINSNLPAAFLDTAIEIGSEQAGEGLGIAGKWLMGTRAGPMLRRAGQQFAETVIGRAMSAGGDVEAVRAARAFARQAGYHGVAGEIFEERVGEIARGLTGLRPDYGATGDILSGRFGDAALQIAEEFTTFAAVPVAFAVANRTLRREGVSYDAANDRLGRVQAALDFEGTGISRDRAREVVEAATEPGSAERMAGMSLVNTYPTTVRPVKSTVNADASQLEAQPGQTAPTVSVDSQNGQQVAQTEHGTPTDAVQTSTQEAASPATEAAPQAQTGQNQQSQVQDWHSAYAQAVQNGMSQQEAQASADKIGDQEWVPTGTQFDAEDRFTSRTGNQFQIQAQVMPDGQSIRVSTVDSSGKEIGRVLFDRRGKTRGGRASGQDYTAGGLRVDRGFEGQGIANAMYDFAAGQMAELRASNDPLGGRILPSDSQTSSKLSDGTRGGGKSVWERNAERARKPAATTAAAKPAPVQDPTVVSDTVAMLRATGLKQKEAEQKIKDTLRTTGLTYATPADLLTAAMAKGDQQAATYQSIDDALKNPDPGETPAPKTRNEAMLERMRANASAKARSIAPPSLKEFAPEARTEVKTVEELADRAPGEEFMTPESKSEAAQMFERMATGERVSPEDIERTSALNQKESHVLFQRLEGRTLEDIGKDAQIWGKPISKQGVAKWEAKAIERSGLSKELRERIQKAEKARNAANLIAQGKTVEFAHDADDTRRAAQAGIVEREAGVTQLETITQLILQHKGPLTNEQRELFARAIAESGTEPQVGTSARGQAAQNLLAQSGGETAAPAEVARPGANAVGQTAATSQSAADPLTLAMAESQRRLVELRYAKDQLEHWEEKFKTDPNNKSVVEVMRKKVRKAQTTANAAEKVVRGIEDLSRRKMPDRGSKDYMIEMNLRQPNVSDFMRAELELQKSKYGAMTVMQEILQPINGVVRGLDIDHARNVIGKEVLESYPPQLFQKNGRGIDQVAQEMEDDGRIPETPARTTPEKWLMELIKEHYLTERGNYDDVMGKDEEDRHFANLQEEQRVDEEEAAREREQESQAMQTETVGEQYTGEEEVAPGVSFYDPRQAKAVQDGQLPPGPNTGSVVGPFQFIKSALEMFGLQRYIGKVRQNADAAYLEHVRALEQSGMSVGDVPVAMHEIGHDIMAQYKFEANPVLLEDKAGPDVPVGLMQFDYRKNPKQDTQAVKEGFAEIIRIRTTSAFDPTMLSPAQQAAVAYVDKWLAGNDAGTKLNRLREMYQQYAGADPITKMAALVSPDGKPVKASGLSSIEQMKKNVQSAAQRFQDLFDDRLAVYNRLAAERVRLGMMPFAAGFDPRSVIAQTEFLTGPWADEMGGKGMFTFVKDPDLGWVKKTFGKPVNWVTENIQDGEKERFKDFLIANHVVNQVARGIELLKSGEEADRVQGERMVNTASPDQLATMNQFLDVIKPDADMYGRFQEAAQRYTQLWSDSLDAMVQVGFKRQAEVDRLREIYPDYVPLVRVMENKDFKAQLNEKRTGSGRQFIDPFVTLEARYRLLSHIMQKQIANNAIWDSGEQPAGPRGVGSFWREVDTSRTVRYTDLAKVIESMGVDDQLRDDLVNMIGASSIDMLQPPAWKNDGQNLYSMMIDGVPHTIEVADKALYEAMVGTQGADSNMVGFGRAVASIYGMEKAVSAMKFGATGASMVFQPRNALRDPWSYFQNVKGNRGFLTNFVDLLAGQKASFWSALEKVMNRENSDVYSKLYRESAGMGLRDFSYSPEGAGAEAFRDVKGEKQSKIFKVVHKVGDMLELMGAAEHGPRMAEFRHALEEMGYTREKIEAALQADPNSSPIPLNVMVYARQRAAEATVDFARQGVFTKQWNKVAPFFGAHMAAMSQELRNWNGARVELQSGTVGPKAKAMVGGLGVYLAAELLHFWFRKDEPWYKELPAHLRHGWFILGQTKDGGVWGIPKPQGISRMLGAYFQETLRAAGDREARFGLAGQTALGTATPRISPIGVGEAYEVATNRSWSGRPIVPTNAQHTMSDFDQWTRYRLPYIMEQMSGGLASERAIRPPWEAFQASRTEPRQSVDDYYSRLEELRNGRAAAMRLNHRFEGEGEYARLHAIEDRMRDLNRELRGERQVGQRVVKVAPPAPERQAAIRLQQLTLVRRALQRK